MLTCKSSPERFELEASSAEPRGRQNNRDGSHPSRQLRILIINTRDLGGGAEHSAWSLFQAYRARGAASWLAVGDKRSDDPHVVLIPNEACRSSWAKSCSRASATVTRVGGGIRGADRLAYMLRWLGDPGRWAKVARGYEDHDFPGTWKLLELVQAPHVVHCFNLHGDYFDLSALPWLSQRVPVILDLRDAWLLSGHCAHSFDCERWQTGCGQCPDLAIYPPIQRDGTANNWRRKQAIFTRSRLYVSTPSRWLMDRVRRSMLGGAMLDSRIVPTGVDTNLFRPMDKRIVRQTLGLPPGAKIALFVANRIRRNPWKDYETLRAAFAKLAERWEGESLCFVALGEDGAVEQRGNARLVFIPYQARAEKVAAYYQAADLYVHAAKADTFPRVVLEALACGTPVVATAVGGIPEQVKAWRGLRPPGANGYGTEQATGALVPAGDADALAESMRRILTEDAARRQMAKNAAKDARERFDLERQAQRYLEWYEELLEAGSRGAERAAAR